MPLQDKVVLAFNVKCDGCGKESPLHLNQDEARKQAKAEGYQHTSVYENTVLKAYWKCAVCSAPPPVEKSEEPKVEEAPVEPTVEEAAPLETPPAKTESFMSYWIRLWKFCST